MREYQSVDHSSFTHDEEQAALAAVLAEYEALRALSLIHILGQTHRNTVRNPVETQKKPTLRGGASRRPGLRSKVKGLPGRRRRSPPTRVWLSPGASWWLCAMATRRRPRPCGGSRSGSRS